jgi:HEPN domain-containing protein
MVNIQKQIDYWINGADDDFVTADLLIRENRALHGLFFCHLVIEKAIKAHYVKETREIAPRSHNLIYLSEGAKLEFDNDSSPLIDLVKRTGLEIA